MVYKLNPLIEKAKDSFADDIRKSYKDILSPEIIEKSVQYWNEKLDTFAKELLEMAREKTRVEREKDDIGDRFDTGWNAHADAGDERWDKLLDNK